MGHSRCSDEPRWLNVAKIWRSKHGSVMCRHYHVVGLREEDVLLDDTHVGRLPQFPPAPLSQLPNSLGHLPTEFFLSVKTPAPAAFDAAQSYPTSLIFCAGPNAHVPNRALAASSMRRTYSARAHDDMAILAGGAAWAVYAALHASAACGCDAVLMPFVSGGLYAGPHDRDTLRFLFRENIQLMLDGGFNRAPPLGVHFRRVIVVFLPP